MIKLKWVKIFSWVVALVIIALNVQLVIEELNSWISGAGNSKIILQLTVLPVSIGLGLLLLYIALNPFIKKRVFAKSRLPHGGAKEIIDFSPLKYNKIAVTVDFSELDRKTIKHATSQGGTNAEYVLIHVVETAGARLLGNDILDYETNEDTNYLRSYTEDMTKRGFKVEYHLGFGDPVKTIPKIIDEFGSELLVMGTHGHGGIKDLIFGQTVNPVRHKVKIPVLVVT